MQHHLFYLFSKKDRGSTVQFSTYLYNTLIRVKRLALNYWVMIKDEYFFLYRSSMLHNNVITTNNDNRLTPNNLYIIVIINLWYETLLSHRFTNKTSLVSFTLTPDALAFTFSCVYPAIVLLLHGFPYPLLLHTRLFTHAYFNHAHLPAHSIDTHLLII